MGDQGLINDMILEMEKKYGEDFTLTSICEGQPGGIDTMIQVDSKKEPEAEILVRSCPDESGGRIQQDNYLSYCLRQGIREEMMAIASGIYEDCKVYYRPASMVLPPEYSREMSVEEFLSQRESLVHVYFYLPPGAARECREEQAERLRQELCQRGYKLKGLICYIGGQDYYDEISDTAFRAAYMDKERAAVTGIFLLEGEQEYTYLRWNPS